MKKQDRKKAYSSIISLMLKGDNEKAFSDIQSMCAEDTGLFIFVDYKKEVEKLNKIRSGE